MDNVFESLASGASFRGESSRKGASLFASSSKIRASVSDRERTATANRRRAFSGTDPLDFFSSAPPSSGQSTSAQSTHKKAKKKKKRKRSRKRANSTSSIRSASSAAGIPFVPAPIRAEEVAQFRARLKIKVSGSLVPDPFDTFAGIMEKPETRVMGSMLLSNIENMEYKEPTPVQMQSLPCMLGGRDVLVCAPTGSGKTAAFLIPLIMKLRAPRKGHGVRALVVSPTRELAVQIMREFERLSKGKKFRSKILKKATAQSLVASGSTSFNADFMVCTPMRLVSMIQDGTASLGTVEMLVLDEADKLFEMGFLEQVDEIIAACGAAGSSTQRAMFSATIPPKIEELASTVLRDPVHIRIGAVNAGASTIDQKLMFVGQEDGKLGAVRQMIQEGKLRPPVIIFVQSKERAKDLYAELVYDGINVDAIHSERTQAKRDEVEALSLRRCVGADCYRSYGSRRRLQGRQHGH